jgi:hypothetical protein
MAVVQPWHGRQAPLQVSGQINQLLPLMIVPDLLG